MNSSLGLNNPYLYSQQNMNGYFGNPIMQPAQMAMNNVQRPINNLYGRVINTLEEVKPQEVPMDGSIGIFPTGDYSKIYTKYWDANGRICTEVYERKSGTLETDPFPANSFATIMERLNNIEQMLSKKSEVTNDV